jgi:hypothetical protein
VSPLLSTVGLGAGVRDPGLLRSIIDGPRRSFVEALETQVADHGSMVQRSRDLAVGGAGGWRVMGGVGGGRGRVGQSF